MKTAEQSGAITVEYAVVAAAVVLVFAAIVHLARLDLIGRWVERTKSAFLVSAKFEDIESIWAEVQER